MSLIILQGQIQNICREHLPLILSYIVEFLKLRRVHERLLKEISIIMRYDRFTIFLGIWPIGWLDPRKLRINYLTSSDFSGITLNRESYNISSIRLLIFIVIVLKILS